MEFLESVLSVSGLKQQKEINIDGKCPVNGMMDGVQFVIAMRRPPARDPFFIMDTGELVKLWEKWVEVLPTVRPFYAVKCNPEPALIAALATLGGGFDCASPTEMDVVLAAGVSPEHIIYANPSKDKDHIKYSAKVGVNLTTFDSVEEIHKLRECHSKTAALLRIKVDDTDARVPLSVKFGARVPKDIDHLLETVVATGINVPGVSFHVGSGAPHGKAFASAIATARFVFKRATELGLPPMQMLDIGGGFTAGKQFEDASATISSALELHFADVPNLTVIAEPGRYFAQTVFSEATRVIAKRVRGGLMEYWINDGYYGSMVCIIHDNKTLTALPLACKSKPENPTCEGSETYESTVFGPTCSGFDRVLFGYPLPELEIDDWLVFPNMGAYSSSLASNFNGFSCSNLKTFLV